MRFLQRISAWLSKWTPLFITLVAVGTYFVPEVFGWVRGYTQTAVLGVIMLTMGMTLKGEDFRILASRPLDLLIGSLAQYSVMPLVAWVLVHTMGLPKPVGVGLILVGCCPGGVSSNIMSFLCKGDVAFSVGMTTISTLAVLSCIMVRETLPRRLQSVTRWLTTPFGEQGFLISLISCGLPISSIRFLLSTPQRLHQ